MKGLTNGGCGCGSIGPGTDSPPPLITVIAPGAGCGKAGENDPIENERPKMDKGAGVAEEKSRPTLAPLLITEESEDDESDTAIPGLTPEGGQIHCKIVNTFTKAFAKQNIHFERAIQTLDALNDQIIAFIFSPEAEPLRLQLLQAPSAPNGGTNKAVVSQNGTSNGDDGKYQAEAVRAGVALMRRLLLDAQGKFRKMVEENKTLGGRLDSDLQSAHHQMALIRAELTDTNKRISLISGSNATTPPSTPSTPSHPHGHGHGHGSDVVGQVTTTTIAINAPGGNGGGPGGGVPGMMNGQLSSFAPYNSTNSNYGGGGGGDNGGKSQSPATGSQLLMANGVYSGNNGSNGSNNGSLRSHHPELDFEEPSSTSSGGPPQLAHYLDLDSLSPTELRKECERLFGLNQSLQTQVKDLRRNSRNGGTESRASSINSNSGLGGCSSSGGVGEAEQLQHAKEALSALKADRKRLKAEKFELLNQMKQLYVTLEDKEKELRDFIRNYEQRMRESETSLQRLAVERDEAERERWSILRHARDEAERGLALATQLNLREAQVQQLQEELHEVRRQLSQFGIYAEPESRSNCSNPNNSHYSLVSSLTATYASLGGGGGGDGGGGRGSSADSGVRLSSDRDSGGGLQTAGNLSDSANEALSLDMCGDRDRDGCGSGDGDSMSVISTATLPQLFATPRDSPGPITFASLTRSLQESNVLSKSAEQLLAAEAMDQARRKSGRRSGDPSRGTASGSAAGDYGTTSRSGSGSSGAKQSTWNSISRVFARNKHRRTLDPSLYDSMNMKSGQRSSWSPQSSVPPSPLTEQESYGDKLRALEEAATLPMELWRASMVQAWIEVSLGMPQYGSRCGDNVKSGKVLLELSDLDLETELGITHPMHRKKLRLAIEEHRNPALVRFPCIVELSHVWVSSEWLPDIGLPQYVEHFAACLVDARLLDHLSKKDLEKYLGVTRKFHLASIAHGVHLLRMVAYDRQALAERRRQCENDPLVWTNHRFVQWARSIDLNEYADNLKGSGVHGAFAVLEPTFNGDTLASAMGIPPSKQIIRRHLNAELDALLNPARAKITQQYRVTKSRLSTLEKQRSDSLGRGAALGRDGSGGGGGGGGNDSFRRSTADESRRKTSLRSSLSRALGLKLKQDLAHQRRDRDKEDQHQNQKASTSSSMSTNHRPTDLTTFLVQAGITGPIGGGGTGFSSPYLPSPSTSSQYSDKYYPNTSPEYRGGIGGGSQTFLNGDSMSPYHGGYSPSPSNSHHQHLTTKPLSTTSSRPQSFTSMPSTSTTITSLTMKNEEMEGESVSGSGKRDHEKILETEIVDDDEGEGDQDGASNNQSVSNSVSVESVHKLQAPLKEGKTETEAPKLQESSLTPAPSAVSAPTPPTRPTPAPRNSPPRPPGPAPDPPSAASSSLSTPTPAAPHVTVHTPV